MRQGHGPGAASRRPADRLMQRHEQKQQREAGDDLGQHQRRRQCRGQRIAGAEPAEPRQRIAGQCADDQRQRRGGSGDAQRQQGRTDQRLVVPQRRIPAQRKPVPGGHQTRGVEAECHQKGDWCVEEGIAGDQPDDQRPSSARHGSTCTRTARATAATSSCASRPIHRRSRCSLAIWSAIALRCCFPTVT